MKIEVFNTVAEAEVFFRELTEDRCEKAKAYPDSETLWKQLKAIRTAATKEPHGFFQLVKLLRNDAHKRLLLKTWAWMVKQEEVNPWVYIYRAASRKQPLKNKKVKFLGEWVTTVSPPDRDVWLRKMRKETSAIRQHSAGDKKLEIAIALVEPYSVIDRLYTLYTQKQFQELIEYGNSILNSIDQFNPPIGLECLKEKKKALSAAILCYGALARYHTGEYDRFLKALNTLDWWRTNDLPVAIRYCMFDLTHPDPDRIKEAPLYRLDIHMQYPEFCYSDFDSDLNEKLGSFFLKEFSHIVAKGSLLVATDLINIDLHGFEELQNYNPAYEGLVTYEKAKKTGDFNATEVCLDDSILQKYPEYAGSLASLVEREGVEAFEITFKTLMCEINQQSYDHSSFLPALNQKYREVVAIENDRKVKEKYQARLDERNLVISELSHHIKNLNATVREPLENLRNQPGVPKNILEDALRGTNLIRNIVNAMNLSIGGAKEDFVFDAIHLDDESASLESIIWSALFSAIPNMFDGKHFSKFLRNYFPTREAFNEAQAAWSEASASGDLEKKVACLRHHFFDLSSEISGDPELIFGDTKGSATKMLILCQEIMMNAVKYASTIERDKRDVRILVSQNMEMISIKVENSCNTETRLKTAGLGHTVIKNFASILGCEPQIMKTKERYTLSMEFDNFSHSDKGTAS